MYCTADTALHTKFGKMNEADALAPQCVKSDTRAHTRRATTLLALLALFSLGYWNAFIGTPRHTNSVPRACPRASQEPSWVLLWEFKFQIIKEQNSFNYNYQGWLER